MITLSYEKMLQVYCLEYVSSGTWCICFSITSSKTFEAEKQTSECLRRWRLGSVVVVTGGKVQSASKRSVCSREAYVYEYVRNDTRIIIYSSLPGPSLTTQSACIKGSFERERR